METEEIVADVEIRGVPWSRAKFVVANRHDVIQAHFVRKRYYSPEMLRRHLTVIPPGSIVVDIGANVGNHAVFYGLCSRVSKVLAFEPNPVANALLRRNVELNGLSTVDLSWSHLGLGRSSCVGTVVTPKERNLGGSRLQISNAGDIEIVALDSLELIECDFIKIDVEGMEIDVLAGAKETIKRCKPVIAIEVQENKNAAFWSWLEEMRYHVVDYLRAHRPIDYICIPKF